MADAIQVVGLAELRKAFLAADKTLREDLDDALQEAAAPVRADAQYLAGTEISHMTTVNWTRMRIGIDRRDHVVYIAPVERGVKSRGNQRYRRPRFKKVLGPRMDAALTVNRARVVRRLDEMLADVKRVWEKHG